MEDQNNKAIDNWQFDFIIKILLEHFILFSCSRELSKAEVNSWNDVIALAFNANPFTPPPLITHLHTLGNISNKKKIYIKKWIANKKRASVPFNSSVQQWKFCSSPLFSLAHTHTYTHNISSSQSSLCHSPFSITLPHTQTLFSISLSLNLFLRVQINFLAFMEKKLSCCLFVINFLVYC